MYIVYKSNYYSLYQSTKDRCFYIDFGSKIVRTSLCQLLSLRYKLMRIPIENHFDSTLNKHGFEVILLCNKSHLFILTTLEIIDLQRLLQNGFVKLGISANREIASM